MQQRSTRTPHIVAHQAFRNFRRRRPGPDSYRDGKYKGRTFSAYYGHVQVAAEIRNGELVYVDVLRYPTDYRTSRIINSRALPRLESEVVTAQSARVNIVSGATLSSMAFLRSLQTALDRARSGR